MAEIEKGCGSCAYCGCDPDGPYCAAPAVLEKHEFGLDLRSQKLKKLCVLPAHTLYKKRED